MEPIEIECPVCRSEGCEHCKMGTITITGCPNAYCSEIVPLTTVADLFAKGIPPIAGGSLDQSAWFLEANRILQNEDATIGKDSNE